MRLRGRRSCTRSGSKGSRPAKGPAKEGETRTPLRRQSSSSSQSQALLSPPHEARAHDANQRAAQKSNDAKGGPRDDYRWKLNEVVRLHDQEPQPVLRCDHFARCQREPRCSHGDLQPRENAGQRARNDDVKEHMPAVCAETECCSEVILVDGPYAHHGVQRGGKESHKKSDEDYCGLDT